MNLISVIVPCWNEEETIPIYYEHMCPVMDAIDADCELIFVDDGSQDATLSEMKKLSCALPVSFFFEKFRKRSGHLCRSL